MLVTNGKLFDKVRHTNEIWEDRLDAEAIKIRDIVFIVLLVLRFITHLGLLCKV